jgi:exopolysaccharide biosynthesis polyprenyl glycosylphosphotransferase
VKNNASLVYNLFLVIGDFLALVAAFVGAYLLRVTFDNRPLPEPVSARTYLGIFLVLLPFWIIIFGLLGLYNSNIYEKRFSEAGRLFIGSFIGMLFVVFWNFLASKPILPARLVPIYGFILAFVFLVLFRNIARRIRILLFSYDIGLTNVLIIGNTRLTGELIAGLADSKQTGYRIVGVVDSNEALAGKYLWLKFFPTFDAAVKKLGPARIYSIIQTELYNEEDRNREIMEFAQANHIGYRFTPGSSELFVGNLDVELFRSSVPIIAVHQTALLGWGRVVKRLFDLLVGTILLIVTSPFMLIIALSNIFVNGAVFFRQTRLTRFNQKFRVFKFQTVRNSYNSLTPEEAFAKMGKPELSKEYRKNGDYLPNDPRFGKFGRFLRRTSLDELPQLFNIIKGDLSLVGPRALVPEELDLYSKRHKILSVKSGLSGLAQVSGRRNITFEERRQLDMYYVQNWSFWLDIVILIKTIRVVLNGSGAK